jgi:hypothetical protein
VRLQLTCCRDARPAEVAERLVSTKFSAAGTRGFASPTNPKVAVCLRPGTELAFENNVQTGGVMFRKSVGAQLARFRQINTDNPYQLHDAREFSKGTIALVTDLVPGQMATVVQLPASPVDEMPPTSRRAVRQTAAVEAADFAGAFTPPGDGSPASYNKTGFASGASGLGSPVRGCSRPGFLRNRPQRLEASAPKLKASAPKRSAPVG